MEVSEIARLLPAIYQDALEEGSVLSAILSVMEMLHESDETVLANFGAYLDPRRAPDPFVRMLAGWLALGPYVDDDRVGERRVAIRPGPLRELVAIAAEAGRLRGTEETIVAFLEAATGVDGFSIVENPSDATGRPQPFHIRVAMPAGAAPQRELVHRLVAGERPAWVTFELFAEGQNNDAELSDQRST